MGSGKGEKGPFPKGFTLADNRVCIVARIFFKGEKYRKG
jgi:hypothetical protein